MPFGLRTQVGPQNDVLDEVQVLLLEGAILRGKGQPIVKYRDTAMSCAKTAKPIEMPFGIRLGWAQRRM